MTLNESVNQGSVFRGRLPFSGSRIYSSKGNAHFFDRLGFLFVPEQAQGFTHYFAGIVIFP